MNGSQEKSTTTLRTEPSFCIYSEDDDHNKSGGLEINNEDLIKKNLVENTTKILETQFSFGKNSLQSISEDADSPSRFQDLKIHDNNSNSVDDPDKNFQMLIRQNPSNPLLLRKYAEFLESKGDLLAAEKYYFHATLADPKDAEILCQYAKLAWELHHDHRKVVSCFERAIQAAPEDSHIRAAYASFLWEIDEDKEDDSLNTQAENANNQTFEDENRPASPRLHLAMGLGINLIGYSSGNAYVNTDTTDFSVVEEYYRRLVEENPFNPLYLSDYAHYLQQSKGDLHGAEDYYSRAILIDPSNGQVLSLYANLVWQLHGDKHRAISYFERAIQARPNDSEVLGSYAKFLWEVDDNKDDFAEETSGRTSIRH